MVCNFRHLYKNEVSDQHKPRLCSNHSVLNQSVVLTGISQVTGTFLANLSPLNVSPKVFRLGQNTQFLVNLILWLLSANANDKLIKPNKPDIFRLISGK